MGFEERNSEWSGTKRFFGQDFSRTTTPRIWSIEVEGHRVTTSWGQVGGKLQTATEAFQGVNLGKKNEMSPDSYALDRAREMCRKKVWEGYREHEGNGLYLDAVVAKDIDFDALPLSLSFYKPDNSMGATITKKADAGDVWYSRKRNGLMYVISKSYDKVRLYSRRMLRQHDDEQGTELTWDDRFSHIVKVANDTLPPYSMLLGELVMDRDGIDDFRHVQSITKSLTNQSIDDQIAHGRPSFYCWDVAFWRREDVVKNWKVRDRYALIHDLDGGRIILPVQFYTNNEFPTPAHAVSAAIDWGWEGFVVVDPDGTYGDRAYNFKGKPDRPGTVCAKLKPEFEDDFIAIWDPDGEKFPHLQYRGERSTKERNGLGIKSVALYQYNPKGELVYISNVSSGLTDEMKATLATSAVWPRVWKVIYSERTYKSEGDETNALIFARYSETREDKDVRECVNILL